MRVPGICIECGRTISKDFIHCPWCGCSQLEKDLVPVGASCSKKSAVCSEGEQVGKSTRLSKINSMLDDLERDMTIFMMRRERNR